MDEEKNLIREALNGKKLTRDEIVRLLLIEDEENLMLLFGAAREARRAVIGDRIFLYGFVYFSTWCRNNCNFCYYRKSNDIDRYRKEPEEILQLSKELCGTGVNLIDLTMGEDLNYHQEKFATVLSMIRQIKAETGLPVMISPGVVEHSMIDAFAEAGAEWYALYQETHNREIFSKLRVGQSYDERMEAKLYAKEKGMLIEEGLLVGVGESQEDIAESILLMGEIGAKQVRVMSFVPQKGSPMERVASPRRSLEHKIIAIMRLMYPDALIPASLDVDGVNGMQSRVDAGASVITSIIPPKSGLMGVAQGHKDVDEGGRTAEEVSSILRRMGLTAATSEEYIEHLERLRK